MLWPWSGHHKLILYFWFSCKFWVAISPSFLLCNKHWMALSKKNCISKWTLSFLLLTKCPCLPPSQVSVRGFSYNYLALRSQEAKAHDWLGLLPYINLKICSCDKISTDKRLDQSQQLPDVKTCILVTILRMQTGFSTKEVSYVLPRQVMHRWWKVRTLLDKSDMSDCY